MARRPTRLGWHYNAEREEFVTPSGNIVTLRDIAQRMQDDVYCRHDLRGPWAGWTIRGDALRPPHSGRNGPRLTPGCLSQYLRWVRTGGDRDDAQTVVDDALARIAQTELAQRRRS